MMEMSEVKEHALRSAAKYGRINDVKTLIESGVNPNAVDEVCYWLFSCGFVFDLVVW